MNREDEFELQLAEWLEDGPLAAPDRAIEAAIEHARAHPRRRFLPAVFRRSAMSDIHAAPGASRRFLHFGRAFAVGLAAVAVLAIALGSVAALIALRQSGAGGPGSAATHIYWATPAGSIGRANLDGTGVNDKFITGLKSPCGVAVFGSYIYWGDDQDNTIGRANLDGSGVNPKFITGTGGACTVASDGTYLYWTTRFGGGGGSIGRANLDGTGVNQSFTSLNGRPNFVGLAMGGSSLYYGNNWGFIGRVDAISSESGGVDLYDHIPLSGTPSGIAISGNYVYWGNSNATTIGRATLDRMEMNESFIRIAGNPGGLATDGTYLYWTSAGKIGRANLDGTGVNQTFIGGISVPVGVAIGG